MDREAVQDKKVLMKLERINNDLEERNTHLEEENNLLKLKVGNDSCEVTLVSNDCNDKVEILLDMVAQKTAESNIHEAEVERLRLTLDNLAPTRLALI